MTENNSDQQQRALNFSPGNHHSDGATVINQGNNNVIHAETNISNTVNQINNNTSYIESKQELEELRSGIIATDAVKILSKKPIARANHRVFIGTYRGGRKVALKQFAGKSIKYEDFALRNEAELLRKHHDCPQIIRCFGIWTWKASSSNFSSTENNNEQQQQEVFEDVIEEGGNPTFVVLEFAPTSLEDVIKSGKLSNSKKLTIFFDMIKFLSYCSNVSPSVVHGDISLGNIRLDENYHVKIIDWDSSITKHTTHIVAVSDDAATNRTVQFCAPEIFRGASKSTYSDLYGAAIIWFCLFRKDATERKMSTESEGCFALHVKQPYGELADTLVEAKILRGERPWNSVSDLIFPDIHNIPAIIAHIIESASQPNPKQRLGGGDISLLRRLKEEFGDTLLELSENNYPKWILFSVLSSGGGDGSGGRGGGNSEGNSVLNRLNKFDTSKLILFLKHEQTFGKVPDPILDAIAGSKFGGSDFVSPEFITDAFDEECCSTYFIKKPHIKTMKMIHQRIIKQQQQDPTATASDTSPNQTSLSPNSPSSANAAAAASSSNSLFPTSPKSAEQQQQETSAVLFYKELLFVAAESTSTESNHPSLLNAIESLFASPLFSVPTTQQAETFWNLTVSEMMNCKLIENSNSKNEKISEKDAISILEIRKNILNQEQWWQLRTTVIPDEVSAILFSPTSLSGKDGMAQKNKDLLSSFVTSQIATEFSRVRPSTVKTASLWCTIASRFASTTRGHVVFASSEIVDAVITLGKNIFLKQKKENESASASSSSSELLFSSFQQQYCRLISVLCLRDKTRVLLGDVEENQNILHDVLVSIMNNNNNTNNDDETTKIEAWSNCISSICFNNAKNQKKFGLSEQIRDLVITKCLKVAAEESAKNVSVSKNNNSNNNNNILLSTLRTISSLTNNNEKTKQNFCVDSFREALISVKIVPDATTTTTMSSSSATSGQEEEESDVVDDASTSNNNDSETILTLVKEVARCITTVTANNYPQQNLFSASPRAAEDVRDFFIYQLGRGLVVAGDSNNNITTIHALSSALHNLIVNNLTNQKYFCTTDLREMLYQSFVPKMMEAFSATAATSSSSSTTTAGAVSSIDVKCTHIFSLLLYRVMTSEDSKIVELFSSPLPKILRFVTSFEKYCASWKVQQQPSSPSSPQQQQQDLPMIKAEITKHFSSIRSLLSTTEFKFSSSSNNGTTETEEKANYWQPDGLVESCSECAENGKSTTFGLLTRRSHCRVCYRVLCSSCCPSRAKEKTGGVSSCRVCNKCMKKLKL